MNNKEIREKASVRFGKKPKGKNKDLFWFDLACHIIANSSALRSISCFKEPQTFSSFDKFLSKKC